jgi:atypical dual specificity phosphatase
MTKHVLRTDPRFLRRQFEKSVGKSIPKILTELITNSDDSYKRMSKEEDSRTANEDFGTNTVIVDHRKKVIRVGDQAQGLSISEMESKFTTYGKESDDRRIGMQTRSLFGKGLRDVLFTQKFGVVKSIKDGISCIAEFYWDDLRHEGMEQPIVEIKQGPRVDKNLRANWGIAENGTLVEFRLRDDVRLPQHSTLLANMSNFYMLRMINSNPKRKTTLTSFEKSKGKVVDQFHYAFPSGEVKQKKNLILEYEGQTFPVELELSISKESLIQGGLGYEEREGGLLTIDEENNVLDLSLFSFDRDPSAYHLYGLLRINGVGAFIKEKLNANPPEVILSEEREGLVTNHPFYRALAKLIDPILEPLVKEERKQTGSRGQFSQETRTKHEDAIEILNKMYRELVGKPETGEGMHGKKGYVPDFIGFIRSELTITKQIVTPLAFLANSQTVPDGSEICIISDNPKITVSPEKFNLDYSKAKDGVVTKILRIVGYESDTVGKLEANVLDHKASTVVSVIDKEIFYPENGIEFHPSKVRTRDGKKRKLHLFVDAEKIPLGASISFKCTSPNFVISTSRVEFNEEMKVTPDIGHISIGIEGHGIGQEALVEAKVNDVTATASVSVVSKKDRKLRERGSKFKPPEFMHIPTLKVQTWIRPDDGTILINLSDPVNKGYFGNDIESAYSNCETKLHCQMRLADLVLDECLNEIVSNAWGRTLTRRFPDNPEVDIRLYVAEKKFEMGQMVHAGFVVTRHEEPHTENKAIQEETEGSLGEKVTEEDSEERKDKLREPNERNFSWVVDQQLAGCAAPQDDGDLTFLREEGITMIVRLSEKHKAKVSPEQIGKAGLIDIHEPVADGTAPSPEQIEAITKLAKDALDKGDKVVVSCDAGRGRTGTILTCILIRLGFAPDGAISKVQDARHQSTAWETDAQYQAILAYARKNNTEFKTPSAI